MVIPDDELVIVRLWRWDPERLADDARLDHSVRLARGEADPDYSVSVFASQKRVGDSDDLAVHRAIALALAFRDAKWAAVVTRNELLDAGFSLRKNEPPPGHYDVPIHDPESEDEMKRLARVFDLRERWRARRVELA